MKLRIEKIVNGYLIVYDIGKGEQKVFAYSFDDAIRRSKILTDNIGGEFKNAYQK